MHNNQYFILRHGESKANVAEIILSDLEDGKKEEFTLTEHGEQQVKESIAGVLRQGLLDENVIIYASPFSRCRRTAEIARTLLGVKKSIRFDDRLRERWFGDFEKSHNRNYQKVWDEDRENEHHVKYNVESADEVKMRALDFIKDLEQRYQNKKVLLVSHGDLLQILQTYFLGKSSREHRSIPHLKTGEVRKIV